MYRKDYILRMIEMFGEMLRGILGMIRKKKYEEASEAIENAYSELLQQSSSEILKLSPDNLPGILQSEYNYNQQQLEIVAGLLFAEGELDYAKNDFSHSLINYQKSIIILKYLDQEQKIYSLEHQNRIAQIENRIKELATQ